MAPMFAFNKQFTRLNLSYIHALEEVRRFQKMNMSKSRLFICYGMQGPAQARSIKLGDRRV